MLGSSRSRLSVSIIFLVWTTGSLHALALGLSGTGTVQMAAGQGFGPKLQLGGSVSFDVDFPLAPWLALSTSLDLFGVLPSDTQGGFVYRGFGGGALTLTLRGRGVVASTPRLGEIGMGGGLAASAALPGYQYTSLYFFYPEAGLEGFIDFRPAGWHGWSFRLSIPVRAQFRRDLDYSLSTGAGLSVQYFLKGGK
jgi:hypothetical protein